MTVNDLFMKTIFIVILKKVYFSAFDLCINGFNIQKDTVFLIPFVAQRSFLITYLHKDLSTTLKNTFRCLFRYM